MAPPGRRRFGALTVVLALFCVFASTAHAASAVLGVDLGTSYLKGVLVKPGIPLEVVLSKDSKRKEAAAVALKTPRTPLQAAGATFPERAYGGDALALSARFPADVYPNLKPLLGERIAAEGGSPAAQEYQRLHPAVDMVGVEGRGGTVGFRSPSFEADAAPFGVEELLAMQLQNLRENAEEMAGAGARITDAVITVPAFYTAAEKRAVELAAELAGLKVLALVSDGVAVGLNYATSRTFPSISEGGKPEYHMVFDMGAGSTTATVLRFQGRTVKDVGRYNKTVQEVQVLSSGWDKNLGGDSLNELIVEDIIEQFVEKPEAKAAGVKAEDVKKHGRTMAKLTKDVEKVRQVLSANQESSASWEGLYQDVDFKYKISRTRFEELAAQHAVRVQAPVQQALDAANLTFADLDSVILHGGVVRTPFVQKTLEGLAGDASKLRSNVNADEAAVFGAAFKGAGLSPSFRVKEIRDSDTANFAVNMKYMWNLKERNQKLFSPSSRTGTVKEMPFKMLGDFEFTLSQETRKDHQEPVLSVRTGNLTAVVTDLIDKEGCNRDDINTKFSIKLDPATGLPEIVKAEASCEVDEAEKKGSVVDGVKGLFGFGSKDGKQEPLKEGEEDETTETVEPETSSSSASSSSTSESAKASESAEVKTPKKKVVTSSIRFSTSREGFEKVTKEEMKRMKNRLVSFDASDRARIARETALNELEAFTYRSRDLLEEEGFLAASTDAQRTEIQAKLSEVSDWLYGDGSDADEKTLKDKHAELKGLINPVVTRRDEARKRPDAVENVKKALDQTQSMIKLIKETVDKAAEASSSAAAAASAASASASSSSPTPAAESSGEADPLADLEEEENASPSSAAEDAQATEQPAFLSPYTQADLDELTRAFEDASGWLDEKLAAQDGLAATEDAVVSTAELERRADELNRVSVELLQRKLRMPAGGGKKSSSGSKKSGSDKKKNNSKAKGKKDKKAEKAEKAAAEEEVKEGGGTTPEHEEL
ncbi:heat shock protein 70-like protein [Diplodia corticola]|uniref:Heat shock protein 70-like protein n=1 Tax=Diplodia corticola TaxID=236234 RepID=A0A1J9RCH9_9PEZI|nr:heat shock protein 70-like protein [Diplodia corticola]OJD30187.1 heat shock protein 70-like protein [Diplodia corticola]